LDFGYPFPYLGGTSRRRPVGAPRPSIRARRCRGWRRRSLDARIDGLGGRMRELLPARRGSSSSAAAPTEALPPSSSSFSLSARGERSSTARLQPRRCRQRRDERARSSRAPGGGRMRELLDGELLCSGATQRWHHRAFRGETRGVGSVSPTRMASLRGLGEK
jgi:hypothetical protein